MKGVRATGIIFAASVAMTLAGSAAVGQPQQSGMSALKGHNSNAPVDVTAERIEVQDRADRAIFAGNVHATQAEMTLDTERLTVAYSNKPGGAGGASGSGGVQIHRLDAAGGVVVHIFGGGGA